jgi:spermidine/putrescine transport system substrate-binding protein
MKSKGILPLVFGMMAVYAFADGRGSLVIYNWFNYVPDSIIEKFEDEYDVTVRYDTFDSLEEMYARLRSGDRWDLVFPDAEYFALMAGNGMLERIDHSLLSNLGNIDPRAAAKGVHDPYMEYGVPYFLGAAGLAVNAGRVGDFEPRWSLLAREDLRGRVAMMGDMRQVLGAALKYLGFSVNSTDPREIGAAADFIIARWKPNVAHIDDDAGRLYRFGEVWVAHDYMEAFFHELGAGGPDHTVFFIPGEGGPAYLDYMCIPSGAENRDLAHRFIDFIHRPEIYAEFTDAFGFPSVVNVPARQCQTAPPLYQFDLDAVEVLDDVGDAAEWYRQAWEAVIE